MSTNTKTSPESGPTSASPRATEPRTSVVVPVYNERDNLPQLVEELHDAFAGDAMADYRPWELIFVEDESTDGTAEEVDRYASIDPGIVAVRLRRSWGQSAALAAGFDAASGEYVIAMDGDLQNDPRDIPVLLQRLEEGYDCVSGWRKDRHDPWHKTIPSAVQTYLAKFTGPDINDFGCTLKAYRAAALDEIDLYGEGHRYIPAKLHDKGYSITEVEVNHRPRIHGDSRYGVGRLVRGFVDLLYHWFWVRYSTRPIHLFGLMAAVTIAAGLLVGAFVVADNWFFGGPDLLVKLPELVFAVGSVLFGAIAGVFGVVLEFLTKLYYRDDTEYRIERVVE